MKNMKGKVSKENLSVYMYFCFTAFLNLRFVTREYAWADDWSFLGSYVGYSPSHREEHLAGFRPILQLVFDSSFSQLDNVKDLAFLRIISVLGTMILSFYLYWCLRKLAWSPISSFCIAGFIQFLPSFQIYQKWATAFAYSWIALLSLLSFTLLRNNKIPLAFLLLNICFLTYQPAATFGLVLVLANYLVKGTPDKTSTRFAILTVGAFVTSTITSRVLIYILGIEPKERSGVISNFYELIDKVVWVVSRPLVLSIRPFTWDSPSAFEALSLFPIILIVASATWLKFRSVKAYLGVVASYLFLFCLMLLPLLPLAENQIEFRTLPATSVAGLMIMIWALKVVIPRRKALVHVRNIAVTVSFVLIAYTSNSISQQVFIKPYDRTKNFILEDSKKQYGDELFYKIEYGNWPMRDYVGSPSVIYDLQMSWVVEPMLKFTLENKFNDFIQIDSNQDIDSGVLDLNLLKTVPLE